MSVADAVFPAIAAEGFFTTGLAAADPDMAAAIRGELRRQQDQLELIASGNIVSLAVLGAPGSVLTNKYAEGYPGRRYYGGCEFIDEVEQLAIDRACSLFGSEHANVQPHSGSGANMAVYFGLLEPGDRILGLELSDGGHLTHGSPVNFSGRFFDFVRYGLHPETQRIDYDAVREIARRERPRMLQCGYSAYPREIDFEAFASIAREVDALLFADIAHIAGLVVSGLHPTPVGRAQIVTTTTHKTLRGPRGGLILCDHDWAKKINSAVFPGGQGGPLMHVIAAKAVAFREAASPAFKAYCQQIVDNGRALARTLSDKGHKIVSGGTDTHLFLLSLVDRDITGKAAQLALERAGITANKNMVPFDPRKPMVTSGLRLGTPAVTTRGMKEAEMELVAGFVERVLENPKDVETLDEIRGEVEGMCREFPLYEDRWNDRD